MEDSQIEDSISLEDSLDSLKRNAVATQVMLQETLKSLKQFQKKLMEETTVPASAKPLQPKTRMMKWLTDRHLGVESSFSDFFEAFLDEHKQEHRLDLSTRSIQLNDKACVLLGYELSHTWVSVYEVLEKALRLYE